jgi:hypothetical protein
MREFLIFLFTFDNLLLIFLTNCFYRTLENFLNNMITIEKKYVYDESSVICWIQTQQHGWCKDTTGPEIVGHFGS